MSQQRPPTGDNHGPPDPDPRAPTWVYAFGVIAAVLAALFALLHLTVGGLGHHATTLP